MKKRVQAVTLAIHAECGFARNIAPRGLLKEPSNPRLRRTRYELPAATSVGRVVRGWALYSGDDCSTRRQARARH
jgi:hypothetical protein